jgi:long-chain acyl-CoA synthetase
MEYKTISQMFLNTTSEYSSKSLYYYKKNNDWIGIKGSDVRATVRNIASGLRSIDIGLGDNVAILSTNSPRWAMSDFGVICNGSATVTVYPTLLPAQIEYILNNSDSKAVFVENQDQLDKINDIRENLTTLKHIVVMDDSLSGETEGASNFIDFLNMGQKYEEKNSFSLSEISSQIKEDDLLTIIYTSGTTGNPKGVMLTHKNLISNVIATINMADLKSSDNHSFLSFLPLSHVLERMTGHFTGFALGCTVYYAESIETVADNLGETNPSIVVSVPRLFEKMYNKINDGLKTAPSIRRKIFKWAYSVGEQTAHIRDKSTLTGLMKIKFNLANKLVYSKVRGRLGGNIRFFVSGGAPLSKEVAEFFSYLNITILEGYGLTETSPVLTSNTETDLRFGTVGKPIFNVEIKIADDGEILAKGPNIMKGYYKNDEATAKSIDSEGWFCTGDIGEFDDDGFLKITDRKKSLIVTSGGKNIAPAPLENALITSIYIEQVVAVGDKRNFISALITPNFEALEGYLKSKGHEGLSPTDMASHQDTTDLFNSEVESRMESFPNYEKIKKISVCDRLFELERGEITPSLKIKRKVVTENFKEAIDAMYDNSETSK